MVHKSIEHNARITGRFLGEITSCIAETQQATNVLPSNLVGEWSNISGHTCTCTRNDENMHHPHILKTVQIVGFRCEGHI